LFNTRLLIVGHCVACATPPVDNPAPAHFETAEDLNVTVRER
jgi:hypothetical protein